MVFIRVVKRVNYRGFRAPLVLVYGFSQSLYVLISVESKHVEYVQDKMVFGDVQLKNI